MSDVAVGRTPSDLTRLEMMVLLSRIRDILWHGDSGAMNPDKPWSPDTLDEISDVLARAGLKPSGGSG